MITTESIFGLIMGLLVAWAVEKYYIGRWGVLPNVVGIYILLVPFWVTILKFVKWWIYIGFILGIIALIFVLNKKKFPSILYDVTYPFYSGKTIMGIYIPLILFKEYFPNILFSTMFWIITVICIIVMWYVGIKYFKNDHPFKKFF
ncbi:MAG: hypothetical protein ISS82_04930 [Nanoarchaeota archaeon]|nr:hypothetical protein [Nanoarchaeota archaeon]